MKKYPIKFQNKYIYLTENQIGNVIKKELKKSKVVRKLFNQYDVSIDNLDNLEILVEPLDKQYALTDARKMRLNEILFRKGVDFFRDYFPVVCAHEILHFCKRVREEKGFFYDSEEIQAYIVSAAMLMEKGYDFDEIWNVLYPKTSWHFHSEQKAKLFFEKILEEAKKILV